MRSKGNPGWRAGPMSPAGRQNTPAKKPCLTSSCWSHLLWALDVTNPVSHNTCSGIRLNLRRNLSHLLALNARRSRKKLVVAGNWNYPNLHIFFHASICSSIEITRWLIFASTFVSLVTFCQELLLWLLLLLKVQRPALLLYLNPIVQVLTYIGPLSIEAIDD